MTSMPWLTRPLITRITAFSLPGMAREEKITRSPRETETSGCSSWAMRESTARGSPWLPVQSASTLSAAGRRRHRPSGIPRCRRGSRSRARPARCGPSRGRPRPLRARPGSRFRDGTQPRHVGGEGRDRDARRRGTDEIGEAFGNVDSDGERPSRTALVEIADKRETALVPSARSFASSVRGAMTGVGSIFQSPVWSTAPSGVQMMSPFDSGSNGPWTRARCRTARARNACQRHHVDRNVGRTGLAFALGLEQRRGKRRRVDRQLQLRPQVEQRAEMVLVPSVSTGQEECGAAR